MLDLSEGYEFARPFVNSGRLSVPCTYDGSPLNGPDAAGLPARTRPGSPAVDAPVSGGWLLDQLGNRFQLIGINADVPAAIEDNGVRIEGMTLSTAADPSGALAARYLGTSAAAIYLMRPDQHVAARWTAFDEAAVRKALATALARS